MKIDCTYCGRETNKKPSRIKKRKNCFCSSECFYKFSTKSIEVLCESCGDKILRTPNQIAKSKSGKSFCSRSCTASWNNQQEWRTGSNHPNWVDGSSSARGILGDRLNECNRCGLKDSRILQAHHIDRNRANNDINNLEALCPNCHVLDHYLNKDGLYNRIRK